MSDVASMPGVDPIHWLREGDDASVRYFTLTGVLGAAPDDSQV